MERIIIRNNAPVTINRAMQRLTAKITELEAKLADVGGKAPSSSEQAETDVVEDVDELREQAKELGIKSWHVMGADKLKESIKAKLGA